MISLAELRARNVTPIWQEAVAVVQELIQTVRATTGSAELLPDLEHIALIPNGDVVALPGSPEPAVPVRHAAVMLQLLLDGTPVPPELEQFVVRNVAEPPQHDTVAEFSRNLAFFERPGRRSDVERLVGRAAAAEQTSRAEEELRRLKARAEEMTHAMAPPELLEQPRKARTVPIPLVAGIGVVLIAAILWAWQWATAPQPPTAVAAGSPAPAGPPGPAADAASSAPVTPASTGGQPGAAVAPPPVSAAGGGSKAQGAGDAQTGGRPTPGTATDQAPGTPQATPQGPRSLLDRASDAVRSAVSTLVGSNGPAPSMAAAAKPPAESKVAGAPRPRARRTAKPAVPVTPPAPEPVAVAATPPVVVPQPAPAPPPAPVSSEPPVEVPIEVYTAADPTVTPAVIVRPVLPKEPPPGVPPEQVGTIDVIVDEQGDVVSVKLMSPANRFHERMLVSAAKMWKFRPAYKDGRPVRYKARVRLTI